MKARHSILPREISSPQGNMLQMKICNILPKVVRLPLFHGHDLESAKAILGELHGVVRSFDAGEVVLHECAPAESMLLVVSGVLFVRECGLAEDSRHLVQRLYAGGTFGATFPALDPETYPGMLIAEVPSEVLFLGVAPIRRMMEKGMHPRFLANLYAAVCAQGFYAWRKLMLLSCYEIGDRVLLYLKWRKEDGFTGTECPTLCAKSDGVEGGRKSKFSRNGIIACAMVINFDDIPIPVPEEAPADPLT